MLLDIDDSYESVEMNLGATTIVITTFIFQRVMVWYGLGGLLSFPYSWVNLHVRCAFVVRIGLLVPRCILSGVETGCGVLGVVDLMDGALYAGEWHYALVLL